MSKVWLIACRCTRVCFALCLGFGLLVLLGAAQQIPSPDQQYPDSPTTPENTPSKPKEPEPAANRVAHWSVHPGTGAT